MLNTSRENIDYDPLSDEYFQIVNDLSRDHVLRIYGYIENKFYSIFYHCFALICCGLPYMICSWYPQYKIVRYQKSTLKEATIILLKDSSSGANILPIHNDVINISAQNRNVRYFQYQRVKYIWQNDTVQFVPLIMSDTNAKLTFNHLLECSFGVTHEEQNNAIKYYGPNVINVEVKSYTQLFIDEVFNPFYLFQLFSITLWSFDEYYTYAGCILVLSLFSIVTSLYETRKQSQTLHDLVQLSNVGEVQVYRPLSTATNSIGDHVEKYQYAAETVESAKLVPNDLIILPPNGCVMPCDAVLLTGLTIVNESMLTGESVPVTKTPPNWSDDVYDVDLHKRHTLYAGTRVIQTRYYDRNKVLARVVRTGFSTSKGELVKSILYPKPIGLQFYRDAVKFVACLSVIALAGMVYCVCLYVERNATIDEVIIRALDIITIVVPPALPAAMTIGTMYSQRRLRKKGIFSISPPRINVCGQLKLICFDKTGTLTQEGLDFYGILPYDSNPNSNEFRDLISEPWTLDQRSDILQAMATCHSLTRIDNVLTGDPLDLNMFDATKWELEEPGMENNRYDMLVPTVVKPPQQEPVQMNEFEIPYEVGIIRQFPFTSSHQCMSVICRTLGAPNMVVYAKGAPERVYSLCLTHTLPANFTKILSSYTTCGYRVIALAAKHMPRKFKWKDAQKAKRDTIECDLTFLGFIIMQNALKPETTPVIKELHAAKIRTVMVTGDNIMTAISVSRDCGMILPNENIAVLKECMDPSAPSDGVPRILVEMLGASPTLMYYQQSGSCVLDCEKYQRLHIALDGRVWTILRAHYSDLIPRIVLQGTIFARFLPEQKTQLIRSLQSLDYVVGMCGDGANDCGALKAAHIGVSLSQAEASVAAPFTSTSQDISCVKSLMLEGRCSLVTSFAIFKYMAMYSLIQFFTILILYKHYTTLGDLQFLYIDLIITTGIAVTMGYQGPANVLVSKRPMSSLVSSINLIPLLIQVTLCGTVQYAALYYLTTQPWFEPLLKSSYVDEEVVICWENTVVFSVSCYQYVILACVYSKGRPYRQSILANGLLLVTSIALVIFTTVLLIYPIEPLVDYFEMMPISTPQHQIIFRCTILIFPIVHFLLAISIETCVRHKCIKNVLNFLIKTTPKNKYKLMMHTVDIRKWLDMCPHSHHTLNC